jgi:hypothetical protein
MPPLPALHIKALDDLATQLRFAPPGAARRQMERAEELFGVITPGQNYPEDWIVFAITGYRPEIAAPSLIVGAALLSDLPVLVERLGVAAGLTEDDLPGLRDADPKWLDADQVCARWKISRKTLDRYRRRTPGETDAAVLPARRVRVAAGREKLYFSRRFVEQFEQRRKKDLAGAASFTRIDPALEAKLVRLAAKYRRRLGWSLNKTAERLAHRYARGHETVRQLLQRHDAAAGNSTPPIFAERGPLTDWERGVVARAHSRGVSVETLAERFRRTRPSIYRVLARERADFLRSLPPPEDHPTGGGAHVLAAPGVVAGLGAPAPSTLAEMLRQAESDPLPDPRAERDRALAVRELRAEAARLTAALPRHNPAAGACDEIETRLRWASRLKAELVRSQFALVFKTIRAGVGQEVMSLSRAAAASLVAAAIDALIDAVEQFDPHRGGRLAAPAGMALNRVVARWARSAGVPAVSSPTRAAAILDPAGVHLEDWTRRVDPWQQRLEPDARVRPALALLTVEDAAFLAARFGWALPGSSGEPPATIASLAPRFGLTLHHASAREHAAIAAALRAARRLSETPRA